MNANGYLPERVMDSSTLSQKRRASLFRESDHDEDVDTHSSNGLARNPPGPTRLIKKPQPRLLYSEAMVLALKDSIARNMRLTNQVVGRHLGSNIHYSKMKSILKQRQHEMITLERYLLSEAFIRTDIWNTIRLQEFFELVHSYGLERQFRDEYWEKNQSSHSANVQKLYDCVKRPLTHLALDDALADQIESWAKDIMSRSVFVPQADHPVIRSAVAIMNIAEQQPRDDLKVWDKLQEGPKRVAQIWTAWCLARNKDWVETTYLAAIILKRGSKSKMIAKCFRRENSALLKLVDNGYDKEACRHWQDMHGKCHVISMQELLSRPVVVNLVGASVASSTQQKTCLSTPSLQKTTHTAKKTGNDLFRVVPSKAKELASISQSQLAITRSPCIQQSSFVQRSSVVSSIERDHSPEDMAQELPILDSSHPKKDRNDERKQSKTINLEMDQPHVKKRKTVSFDLGSPRQAQSSPVVAKSEHETLEGTWTKLEAEVDKKLSPFLRQLDNLSRDVKALSEKHAVFEQTITRKVDDQHTAQGGEHTTFEKTAETKMDELTKLVGSQQTAFAQVVAKMDHRHTMISYEHGDFQQTITKKMDNLSQLIHTLQQDQDEIESRIDRGRKKRPKPTANDEVVDSITCAPWRRWLLSPEECTSEISILVCLLTYFTHTTSTIPVEEPCLLNGTDEKQGHPRDNSDE
ncbi:hypothetical protein Ct61P_07833 [Colletotrichum tofieldiae]|nr:hypothetical protein Ct61P_07833 [Colletotrichum tofieldiae]